MKRITLQSIDLRNFKGAREFPLNPNGCDVSVYGDNAAGKTTIADAFFWTLFDKDSLGRKDFEIKTIGPDGQPLHNLEHEVRLTLICDGRTVELQKTYKENWVKSRGKPTAEFSGHTTDYRVNNVPIQKAGYDAQIAALCDEKTFRLLTDPSQFNGLHWQERRRVLLEVCGDVTDAEVVAVNPKLSDLPSILKGASLPNRTGMPPLDVPYSLDEYRKIIVAERKEINGTITQIATRIDELTRSLPDARDQVPELAPLRAVVQSLNEDKARLAAGGEIAEKTRRLRELEAQAVSITTAIRSRAGNAYEQAQADVRKADAAVSEQEIAASRIRREIVDLQRSIDSLTKTVAARRAEYLAEDAKKLDFRADGICPACHQPIPDDQIAEATRLAEEEFNGAKAKRLATIKEQGLYVKQQLVTAEATLSDKQAALDAIEANIVDLAARRDELKSHAATLEAPQLDASSDPEYRENLARQSELRAEIEALRESSAAAVADVEQRIAEASSKVAEAERLTARAEERMRSLQRIKDLSLEEKTLAARIEHIDSELFLCDTFVRTKVSLLTDRINSRFAIARFKLFDEQVNGAVAECCETTVDGVPWGSLNHGSKVNAGLDVINTLAEHYGFCPPIFIDNSESVTQILPTHGQQIRLVVSESDKALRIVVHSPRAEEAQALAV